MKLSSSLAYSIKRELDSRDVADTKCLSSFLKFAARRSGATVLSAEPRRGLERQGAKRLPPSGRKLNVDDIPVEEINWPIAIHLASLFSTPQSASMPNSDVLPLELLMKGNPLDECQTKMIEIGAYDLVLIENATEIARQCLHHGTNLEKIMQTLSQEFAISGTVSLPSETFAINLVGDVHKFPETTMDAIAEYSEKYSALIARGSSTAVFTILSLDIFDGKKSEGGHFASFIYTPYLLGSKRTPKLYVYDSMSMQSNPDTDSVYAEFFVLIGEKIFKTKDIVLNSCFGPSIYPLQPTGGFANNIGPKKYDALYTYYAEERKKIGNSRKAISDLNKKTTDLEFLIKLQSDDSQDHFCYMWSIWTIIMHLSNRSDILETLKGSRLVVMKKFIWGLIDYLDLFADSGIPESYKHLYTDYFHKVWLNSDEISTDFNVYEIRMPARGSMKSIMDCFDFSIQYTPLGGKVAKTPVPAIVAKQAQKVKKVCVIKSSVVKDWERPL